MASTLTASTMTVSISESITLNGKNQGGSTTLSIASIKDIYKRIVTIAADDDATVAVFKSTTASSDSAFDKENVKYIRITNLDDSNSLNISLQLDSGEDNSAADLSVTHLVQAGRSFIMGTVDEVTDNTNVLMVDNLSNAGVNDKKLYNIHPITLVLSFER